ncbi:MAG TPA: type II secretion system protein [Patescibacteria group bacterium]|jgi:prepilin-type N-terminal cleavage/methylation domain-containing protein|nr:type II secretion system protein [Patescibacteria group bacterium]
MQILNRNHQQSGFTLVEIIVSTAIFVTVVSAMLGLFNYTLQINRRVQALREVVQGTRTFSETITREVRNGRIDYSSWTIECNASNYAISSNTSLGIVTKTGDRLCFYFSGNDMYLKKLTPLGITNNILFNSGNFSINRSLFTFTVRPTRDPNVVPYPQVQPSVVIAGQFVLNKNATNPTTINYQTTISTDVYDISK